MKRSRSIRLVLLGSMAKGGPRQESVRLAAIRKGAFGVGAAGMLALTGCGATETHTEATIFENEAQCAQQNDAAACRQALADARAEHAATAPAFASREACEREFGAANCAAAETVPTPQQIAAGEGAQAPGTQEHLASPGMGFFMPMLLGYTMGSMMGGRMGAQPVWRDARNTAFVGGRPSGTIDPGSLGRSTPARVTRGGFGVSALGSSGS